MIQFRQIIKLLRKSSLDDIAKKIGIFEASLSKKELVEKIENSCPDPVAHGKKKFVNTSLFQIGFPIVTLLAGIYIGTLIDISNKEVSEKVIESNVKESILNSEIKNIAVMFHLNEKTTADSFVYKGFLVRLRSSQWTSDENIETLFVVGRAGNEVNGQGWMLHCESLSFSALSGMYRKSYSFMPFERLLEILPLPISNKGRSDKLFYSVRDLDDCSIELFIPEQLVPLITKIQLSVNSSFQYKDRNIIFSKDVSSSDFENTTYRINDNFDFKHKLKGDYVKSKNTANNKWRINVDRLVIEKSHVFVPDAFRIKY